MKNDKDIQRALKGNPCTIRNSWLMVQAWDRGKDPQDLEFHQVLSGSNYGGYPYIAKP
jgi:hypothetical protein